jgi:hypothetical protein
MKAYFIYSLLFSMCLFACTKHNGEIPEPEPKASITISHPLAGAIFDSGDMVHIEGIAIAPLAIHGYDFIVRRANDTSKLYVLNVHAHNDTIIVSQNWKADISNAHLIAELVFHLDHAGNTASKKIAFSVR